MMTSDQLIHTLQRLSDPAIADHSQRFFKTGPGEYGEGDRFLGIRVPGQRKTARKFRDMELNEIAKLLQSEYHEVRLTALFILVLKFKKKDEELREKIFSFYIRNLDRVNNWDLVDSSAKQIAGGYLFDKDRTFLFELAGSDDLWKRRIAIIATHYFIDQGDLDDTFKISEMLLDDGQDLIHKASGWMLREAGVKNPERLEHFLEKYAASMPRTMLRYAIEKLPEEKRKQWLNAGKQQPY